MQFSDVKQVKQVLGAGNANTLLNEGWELLAVVPAAVNNGKSSAMYVLGKTEPAPTAEVPLDQMTVGDLQRANEGL